MEKKPQIFFFWGGGRWYYFQVISKNSKETVTFQKNPQLFEQVSFSAVQQKINDHGSTCFTKPSITVTIPINMLLSVQ